MPGKIKKKNIVPFGDLTLLTESVRKKFVKAVDQFLKNGNFVLGKDVETFEQKFASYVGTLYAVGASCGADALYLALRALDIKEGDEVITQGNAYNATVTAILRVGATPRFADIDPHTLMLDPSNVASLINKNTKAILVVHLFGSMADVEKLSKIADEYKIALIEDVAQAHGASFKGKKAGAWGTIGCFSFYPTKNLGAFGDAGALTTNDKSVYEKLLVLRNLGQEGKNNHTKLGYNMRLDPLQAIALSLKLPKLDSVNRFRRKAAMVYDRLIEKANIPVKVLQVLPTIDPVCHLYVVELLAGDRSEIMRKLKEKGIESAVHYPLPVYRQPFYKTLGLPTPHCPHTDQSADRILSLPLYYGITEKEAQRVVNALQAVLT